MLEKFIPLIGKIVRTITFNKVLVWGIIAAVSIVSYTIFEKRKVLGQFFFEDAPAVVVSKSSFSVSDLSKATIKSLVVNDDNLAGIIVLSADIRNNQRVPIFWYSDDTVIQRQLDSLYLNRDVRIPLFSSDQKNNEEIVSVINGEFTCTAYDEATNKAIFPGLKDKFPYICRTSLPPYYGQFSGYIAIGVNNLTSSTVLDRIKSESINIATEIYFRDILSTNKN